MITLHLVPLGTSHTNPASLIALLPTSSSASSSSIYRSRALELAATGISNPLSTPSVATSLVRGRDVRGCDDGLLPPDRRTPEHMRMTTRAMTASLFFRPVTPLGARPCPYSAMRLTIGATYPSTPDCHWQGAEGRWQLNKDANANPRSRICDGEPTTS